MICIGSPTNNIQPNKLYVILEKKYNKLRLLDVKQTKEWNLYHFMIYDISNFKLKNRLKIKSLAHDERTSPVSVLEIENEDQIKLLMELSK